MIELLECPTTETIPGALRVHRGGARSRVAVIILLFHVFFFLIERKVTIENQGHCMELQGSFRPTPFPYFLVRKCKPTLAWRKRV